MRLDIGRRSIQLYLWRTVKLLASLASEYIRWPSTNLRRLGNKAQAGEVFANCFCFLDDSGIVLRDRPFKDPEAYFSRKKIYSFNLQAIWNHKCQFVMVIQVIQLVRISPLRLKQQRFNYHSSSFLQKMNTPLQTGRIKSTSI